MATKLVSPFWYPYVIKTPPATDIMAWIIIINKDLVSTKVNPDVIKDFVIGINRKNEFNSKRIMIIKDVRPIPVKNININDLESSSLHHFLVVIDDRA